MSLYWDDPLRKRLSDQLADQLDSEELSVYLASDILSNYGGNVSKWKIAGDGHPNAAAYRQVADYVVNSIVDR